MRKYYKLSVLLFCAAFILGLVGCTTPAGRTAGQVIDDGTITTKVKTKIIGDSILKGFAISVVTFQGEVTLTGAVGTQQEKDRAGRIARDTIGVRKVHNLLKLR